ncbi:MAG: radical SAM protein, partial [Bacteroidales bacterium]|nr:radical SAM protein [Bacteroidales bacterium]
TLNIIVDNSTTAMTGGQDNPGTGKTLLGQPSQSVDLPALIKAGIDGINISLDALDPDGYHKIVRHGELAQALAGLDAAWEAGIRPLKVNCVLMRELNDQEAPRLAAIARERDISVRFIELMPIGFGKAYTPVPGTEILRELSAIYGEPEPYCGIIA